MKPEAYKPVIVKALKEMLTQKVPSVEAAADRLIAKMTAYEDLVGDAVILSVPQQQTSALITDFELPPPPVPARERGDFDITRRVNTTNDLLSVDEIYARKDRAITRLKAEIPGTLVLTNLEFPNGLPLVCQRWEMGMETLPVFRIVYAANGMNQPHELVTCEINVQEPLPSAEQIKQILLERAANLYTATPKKGKPPMVQPWQGEQTWGGDSADGTLSPDEQELFAQRNNNKTVIRGNQYAESL